MQPKEEMVEKNEMLADEKERSSFKTVEKQRQVFSRSPSPIRRRVTIQQPSIILERLADKIVEAAMPPEGTQAELPPTEQIESQLVPLRRSTRVSLPPRRFGSQLVDDIKEICKDVAAGFQNK